MRPSDIRKIAYCEIAPNEEDTLIHVNATEYSLAEIIDALCVPQREAFKLFAEEHSISHILDLNLNHHGDLIPVAMYASYL